MIGKRISTSSLAAISVAVGLAAMPQLALGSSDGLPDGSWRQSCLGASVRDGVLSAVCKSDDGKKARFASVVIGNCQAFANRDGALVCESDGSSGGAVQWGGSFSQSCRDRSTNSNGVLTATCQTADGRWRRTSLSPAQCRSRQAGNQDGTLVCESDGSDGGASQWGGSFSQSCRDVSVDKHGKLQATCRKRDGTYKRSNLQAKKCPSHRAGNQDGTLVCEQ